MKTTKITNSRFSQRSKPLLKKEAGPNVASKEEEQAESGCCQWFYVSALLPWSTLENDIYYDSEAFDIEPHLAKQEACVP